MLYNRKMCSHTPFGDQAYYLFFYILLNKWADAGKQFVVNFRTCGFN